MWSCVQSSCLWPFWSSMSLRAILKELERALMAVSLASQNGATGGMTAPLSVAPRELCVSNEERALRRFACRFGEASTHVLDVDEHSEAWREGRRLAVHLRELRFPRCTSRIGAGSFGAGAVALHASLAHGSKKDVVATGKTAARATNVTDGVTMHALWVAAWLIHVRISLAGHQVYHGRGVSQHGDFCAEGERASQRLRRGAQPWLESSCGPACLA